VRKLWRMRVKAGQPRAEAKGASILIAWHYKRFNKTYIIHTFADDKVKITPVNSICKRIALL
jgi:hypothetical protein